MKRMSMKRSLLALSIGLMALPSTAVFATPGHGHDAGDKHEDRGDHGKRHGDRDDGRGNGWGQASHRRDRDDHGRWAYAHGHRGHRDNGLHLGHYKHFNRGERVSTVYLQPRYYVQDYRVYRLAPPPRGYRWIRPEPDRYLLISTATGLISQILGY